VPALFGILSRQQHPDSRESHNRRSRPSKNLEVSRKGKLAHYLSVTGHEHHKTHHWRGENALDFSGDVSDEARRNIQSSEIEFAKSEAVTQESLGRSPISANLRGRDQDRCWRLEKIGPAGTSRK
jgi:hypothetical protein